MSRRVLDRFSLTQWLGIMGAALIALSLGLFYFGARSRTSAASAQPHDVDLVSGYFGDALVWHDRVRKVTCWQGTGTSGGLSCIPDWQLTPPPDGGSR